MLAWVVRELQVELNHRAPGRELLPPATLAKNMFTPYARHVFAVAAAAAPGGLSSCIFGVSWSSSWLSSSSPIESLKIAQLHACRRWRRCLEKEESEESGECLQRCQLRRRCCPIFPVHTLTFRRARRGGSCWIFPAVRWGRVAALCTCFSPFFHCRVFAKTSAASQELPSAAAADGQVEEAKHKERGSWNVR